MKDLCPICSNILLRHIYHQKITWFCPRCRQTVPNFDSEYVVKINKTLLLQRVKKYSETIVHCQDRIDRNRQIVGKSISWLESFIEEGKIRLAIVDFAISNTKSIIEGAIVITASQNFESFRGNKKSVFLIRKTACLRDAEIILLYICYAILLQNSDLLNNQYLKDLKASYTALNIPGYQTASIINLMKAAVIDFVNYRTGNFLESISEENFSYLILEIASYFDTVSNYIT